MSLKKWNLRGQLSRELSFYNELCNKGGLKLIIFSYGRKDAAFAKDYPNIKVLELFNWIPKRLPFSVQNLIYHFFSLILYRKYFKTVLISKTNQFRAARFGLLLKFLYQIPLVVRMGFYHSHFKEIPSRLRAEERFTFKKADLIITTSFEAGSFIERQYNISPTKILGMCNSIDLIKFKPSNVDKEYDLIFVGRLEKVKNIQLMLEAIQGSNLKTLIIGSGSLNHLIEKATKEDHNIKWKERVENSDLPLYLNKSRCFLLFSQYEGNPKALLEAMACGLPGIGTNVPGIRECIEPGITGILVNQDPQTIKSQIIELLANKNQIVSMAINAENWVRNQSDLNKNINREVNFYFKHLGYPALSFPENKSEPTISI
jgi:glycosyltransferase involved in cell wall biosynthesis